MLSHLDKGVEIVAMLVTEFGLQYRPYRDRVLQIINDVRADQGLPSIG